MSHLSRIIRLLCIPLWAITRRLEERTTRLVYDRVDDDYQVQQLLPRGWRWVVFCPYSSETAWEKYARAYKPVRRRFKVLR